MTERCWVVIVRTLRKVTKRSTFLRWGENHREKKIEANLFCKQVKIKHKRHRTESTLIAVANNLQSLYPVLVMFLYCWVAFLVSCGLERTFWYYIQYWCSEISSKALHIFSDFARISSITISPAAIATIFYWWLLVLHININIQTLRFLINDHQWYGYND